MIKLRHLGAARMAGDVHQMRAVGDDLDALPHQPVDQLADRLLVAGNGARGEDHHVALRQRHLRVLVLGDARDRGARLALAAGAQRHHLVARQIAVGLDAAEIRDAVEIAGLARDLLDPRHRAADDHDLAAGGCGGFGDRAHARHVRREGRDRDASRGAGDQLAQRLRHVGLGGRAAFAHRIGGIADQREAAFVAEPLELRLVGRRADDRRRIELPVAGMQHVAERRADDQRVRFRDRVRHRDKLDIERPDIEAAAERHDLDRHIDAERLAEALGLEQRGGERRRVDRAAQLRPQIEQRAEMILMRVGQHEPGDVAPLLDRGSATSGMIRSTPGRSSPRERDAEIDDEPGALAAVAEAVERRDSSRSRRPRRAARRPVPDDRPLLAGDLCGENLARRDRFSWPAGRRSIRRPRLVERLERAGEFAIREAARRCRRRCPAACDKPLGADGGEARAAIPLGKTRSHCAGQFARTSASGVTATSVRRKIGRRIAGVVADGARS